MTYIKRLTHFFRTLFRLEYSEQELSEEIQFHVDMLTEELMQKGMSEIEARKAALKEFGNVESITEQCRTSWGLRLVDDLMQDIRFGLQQMWKHKGYALITIITLAVCLGANSTAYTMLRNKILKPYIFEDSDRVVLIGRHMRTYPLFLIMPSAAPECKFIEENARSYSHIGFSRVDGGDLHTGQGVMRVRASFISSGFFLATGVDPLLGRVITQADMDQASPVAVISHETWRRYFDCNPDLEGMQVRVDDQTYEVIGIMPPGFYTGGEKTALWLPKPSFSEGELIQKGLVYDFIYARLKEGVSIDQANAEMAQLYEAYLEPLDLLWQKHHKSNGIRFVVRAPNRIVPESQRFSFFATQAITLFVLIIGCLNICGMMVVRGYARRMEFTLRQAVGAGKFRIARQVFTEVTMLFLIGAVASLPLVRLGFAGADLIGMDDILWGQELALNTHMLLVSLAITFICGLVTALFPLMDAFKGNLNEQLHSAGRTVGGQTQKHFVRGTFLVLQIVLSLVLIICAGAFSWNVYGIFKKDCGFKREGLISISGDFPDYRFGTGAKAYWKKKLPLKQEITRQLRQVPGVVQATRGAAPFDPPLLVDILTHPSGEYEEVEPQLLLVSPGYFKTLQLQLRGRDFNASDAWDSQSCIIISQHLADTLFPGENPIGKELLSGEFPLTIIGVAGKMQYRWSGEIQQEDVVYYCDQQTPSDSYFNFLIRVEGDPDQFHAAIRKTLQVLDPLLTFEVTSVEDIFEKANVLNTAPMYIAGFFSVTALLLTALGLYGLLSYSVAERSKEFGIRLALGESRKSIAGRVLRSSGILSLIGLVVGLAVAYLVCTKINPVLTEYDATLPGLFIIVGAFILLVIVLATMVPTLRAVNTNISQALRDE